MGPGTRTSKRRPAACLLGLAALLAISAFAGCSGGEPVTAETIASARKTWTDSGIRDYDLEWTSSGTNQAHYFVTVRGGSVRKVESVAPDGRRLELHPGEPRFFGVDGLFLTMADELAQLKLDRPFGQPKGTRVVMRFTHDPKLGYPLSYRRDVLGTSQSVAISVIRLIPTGPRPAEPRAESVSGPPPNSRSARPRP
jgi:hypothetical protein